MAEFEFILSECEYTKLINYIMGIEGKLIPSLWYRTPKWTTWKFPIEILSSCDQLNGPIFIIWESFSIYPIKFDQVKRNDGIFYFLSQGTGGPYLNTSPWIKRISDKTSIITGNIHYHKKYWIEELDKMVEAPDALKEKYRQIIEYIQSMGSKVSAFTGKPIYWVGNEVLKMLEEGIDIGIKLKLPNRRRKPSDGLQV